MNSNSMIIAEIIVELVGSRHDEVKQSIEMLAKRNVIQLPLMGIFHNINWLGLKQKMEQIEQGTSLYLFT
ncbi:hypothetical protein [Photorhabdus cinerea]|uniref:hypothetical protein n=1 Tax=Photorhabdus cinerea TaxID=471575 RepID=UPI001F6101E3|nr:hypothetical protein [Photorhabdus cinerea]